MRAVILHVGLPVVMYRVALQLRQNPDLIASRVAASLMGIVIGETAGASPMKPVQLPVDAQPGFIKVHNLCTDNFLPDLFHHSLQASSAATIYAGQSAGAHRDGEQV